MRVLLVLIVICSAAVAPAAAPTADQRYLDGLLERRLFGLAGEWCRTELARDDLSPRTRTERLVDLARVEAEQALNAPPDARDAAWKQVHESLAAAREQIKAPSLRALLDRQEALVYFARGRQLRQEAEVVAAAEPLREAAKQALRRSIGLLDQLVRDVQPYAIAPAADEGSLDEQELRALSRDLQVHLAEALQEQALAYPAGSRDRLNALARSVELLRPLAERPRPIDWPALLGLLRGYRLAEQFDECDTLLTAIDEQLEAQSSSPGVLGEIELERARLALDRGQTAAALERLARGPTPAASATAPWDYQRLVALLAAWREADEPSAARQWQAEASEQVRRIEARHGPYWRRRAESLMGRMLAADPQTDDLELLVRAAASYFRAGKLDDAAAAYARALQQAEQRGQGARAFEIGETLGAVEQRRGNTAAAGALYRRIALAQSRHERASAAHLMAAYHAAQALRRQQQPDATAYLAILEEHLEHWPEAASADQARLWLGRMRAQRREWGEALEAFRGVDRASKHFAEAVERTAELYRAWLAQLTAEQQPTTELGREAADYFENIVTAGGTRWPDKFSPAEATAALASARFRLQYVEANYDRTEQLLTVALARGPAEDAAWRAAAEAARVHALAMQPEKLDEAAAALDGFKAAPAADLLALLDALAQAAAVGPHEARRRLAEMQLRLVEQLTNRQQELEEAERARLQRMRAAALVAAGRGEEALASYAALAQQRPDDAGIQIEYARQLLAAGGQKNHEAGLVQWRLIERRTRAGSPRWYEAKLSQALLYEKLGNCLQAAHIVGLMRVLHPNLGGPEMKPQFEALLERCGDR